MTLVLTSRVYFDAWLGICAEKHQIFRQTPAILLPQTKHTPLPILIQKCAGLMWWSFSSTHVFSCCFLVCTRWETCSEGEKSPVQHLTCTENSCWSRTCNLLLGIGVEVVWEKKWCGKVSELHSRILEVLEKPWKAPTPKAVQSALKRCCYSSRSLLRCTKLAALCHRDHSLLAAAEGRAWLCHLPQWR